MPTEKFANEFATTLSSGIDADDTSIPVAAPAPAGLQGGQFRVRIGDELLLVTATGGSGASPWTATRGVEGSVAAVHASGAVVTHVLTAAVVTDHEARLGSVESSSSFPNNLRVVTANTAAAVNDVILMDATGGARTVTAPAGAEEGDAFIVKKTDASANSVIVDGTIDGDAGGGEIAGEGFGWLLESDGADAWIIIGVIGMVADTTPALDAHIADTTAAHAASAIGFTPSGSLAATNVQAAIVEVRDESQPLDSDLTAIAALTTTTYGRALLALADAAAVRTALGLGTAAVAASGDFQTTDSDLTAIAALSTTSFGRGLLTLADAAALLAAAGAQASDAELTALAGLTSAANKLPYFTGSGTASLADLTAFARTLLDDADAAAMLATLGAIATTALDTDTTLAANSDAKIATQKATKAYVDAHTAGSSDQRAVLSADQSVTSSTALVDVTGLEVAISASATEKWLVEYTIVAAAAGSAGDLKLGFSVPSGCTMNVGMIGAANGWEAKGAAASLDNLFAAGDAFAVGLASGPIGGFIVRALVKGGGTAGNVKLRMAQQTSDANATTLKAMTCMTAVKLAS